MVKSSDILLMIVSLIIALVISKWLIIMIVKVTILLPPAAVAFISGLSCDLVSLFFNYCSVYLLINFS